MCDYCLKEKREREAIHNTFCFLQIYTGIQFPIEQILVFVQISLSLLGKYSNYLYLKALNP